MPTNQVERKQPAWSSHEKRERSMMLPPSKKLQNNGNITASQNTQDPERYRCADQSRALRRGKEPSKLETRCAICWLSSGHFALLSSVDGPTAAFPAPPRLDCSSAGPSEQTDMAATLPATVFPVCCLLFSRLILRSRPWLAENTLSFRLGTSLRYPKPFSVSVLTLWVWLPHILTLLQRQCTAKQALPVSPASLLQNLCESALHLNERPCETAPPPRLVPFQALDLSLYTTLKQSPFYACSSAVPTLFARCHPALVKPSNTIERRTAQRSKTRRGATQQCEAPCQSCNELSRSEEGLIVRAWPIKSSSLYHSSFSLLFSPLNRTSQVTTHSRVNNNSLLASS